MALCFSIESSSEENFLAKSLHCVKSVQVRSFFWSVFSRNMDQKKTPYLDTFHSVSVVENRKHAKHIICKNILGIGFKRGKIQDCARVQLEWKFDVFNQYLLTQPVVT